MCQLQRGISGGPALQYFCMIHRGGRMTPGWWVEIETNAHIQWNPVTRQFMEFVIVETKQIVSCNSNTILRPALRIAAARKHRALACYFSVRICFLISKCREESDLGCHRVGLSWISSQVPVSDLGEWHHICHFFRKCDASDLSHFWEECDALAHANIFLIWWRFLSHPSRKTSHFGPAGTKLFWTGRNMTIRLGLKNTFLFTSQICHLTRKREAGRPFRLRPTLCKTAGMEKRMPLLPTENADTSVESCGQTRLKTVCYIHWLFHGQAMLAMSKRNLLHLNWDFEVDLQIRFQSSSWPSNRRIESWSSGKATQYWHGHYHDTWRTLTRIYFMKSPYEGAACHLQWYHIIIADKLSAFICKLNWVH